MLQSYVPVWQEESLIQLLKNLWHHVNYVGNSYYLLSDKGYERSLWKLRGYECVEKLRTTDLNQLQKTWNSRFSGGMEKERVLVTSSIVGAFQWYAWLIRWAFLSSKYNKQTKKKAGPFNPQFPATNTTFNI